jgi:hypothetical protein
MLFLILGLACGPEPDGPAMVFDEQGDFWATPLPGDHRRASDGLVTLAGFPNPGGLPVLDDLVGLLDGVATGFAQTGPIYLPFDGSLAGLDWPDALGSIADDSPVWLVDVDPDSPEQGQRYPIDVAFLEDGGPSGADHLLALLPVQGVPLRPGTTYAAAVQQQLGETLLQPLPDAVRALWPDVLVDQDLGALTVFTTWDPLAEQSALVAAVGDRLAPQVDEPWVLTETYDSYCVYESTLTVPVFQAGEAPYLDGGGGIEFAGGEPVFDHDESARILVSLPRHSMPAAGFPTAVFVRTGGGGDRPMVERGAFDSEGELIEPGSGYARVFAAAGYAGVSVDGPLGGIRNTTGADEQFLIFNVSNPAAMRDNLRQSAAELAALPELLAAIAIDAGDCPDLGGTVVLDTGTLALMGHSMGATIAPVVLPDAPDYDALILSGSGGSWIENIVYKQLPLEVRPLAEAMFGYSSTGYELTSHDVVLSLLQWAGEGADPPLSNRVTRQGELQVLMLQGIVDRYILPPIANAMSVSLGLDLGGDALDEETPEIADLRPLRALLPLSGGQQVSLPHTPAGPLRLVIQIAEDDIQDGHEVAFQHPGPQRAVRCLLEALAVGEAPIVSVEGSWDQACGE